MLFFFFFQAEDGIRDADVTGVQTCALPILAPAELPKQAASFDLPITLGLLAASGQIALELFDRYAVVGGLALDGTTRPTRWALSMAMAAARRRTAAYGREGASLK